MIFHENRLLADNSHEISCLIFFRKLGKMSQNLSSVAVVIDALRAKNIFISSYMVTQCTKLKCYSLVVLHENQNKSDPGNTILQ